MSNSNSSNVPDPLEPEIVPFRNDIGRGFDILAKRRCIVGDLIETGYTEGKIEANRGGVCFVSLCGESGIALVIETCPRPRFTMRSLTDNQRKVQAQSGM